jgi:outer membrane protein OmpA-like peptidoglycan-associated protein
MEKCGRFQKKDAKIGLYLFFSCFRSFIIPILFLTNSWFINVNNIGTALEVFFSGGGPFFMRIPERPFTQPVSLACIAAVCVLIASAYATDDEAAINPSMSCYATRGLTQTISAEAMGEGRMTVNVQGSWYQQKQNYPLFQVPDSGANIFSGIGALSFGINPYIDLFGTIAGYGSTNYSNSIKDKAGVGTVSGGIKGMLPLPEASPIKLGLLCGIYAGTSNNQIDEYRADGYDYFETRTDFDFYGKALESFIIGNESRGLELHLNESFVMTVENNKDNLLLFAAGLQWNVYKYLTIGLEGNSRTSASNISLKTDPLWVTPSVQIRTPYYLSLYVASDITVSQDRTETGEPRALEPFRILGGITFSIDLLASRRNAEAARKHKEEADKLELENKARQLERRSDSLAQKTKEDSLAMIAQKAAQELERKRADSLATLKAQQDSIILAETKHRLDIEKSKRTDAEKQLLSTGLLLLDAVYFESGKTDISINSRPYLNIIGKMLLKYPKLQLEVSGHTDNVGGMSANMRLSQARAESVRAYLIQVAPELSTRLVSHGYGFSEPKADNKTAEGRKINRRVEIQVLNKDVLKEYNQ